MQRLFLFVVTLMILVTSITGCDDGTASRSSQSNARPPIAPAKRKAILDTIAEVELEASKTDPPAANITLATPAGWTRSEPRPLSPSDHGFTVAYDHESGLTVTLYQFTRGLAVVPEELDSTAVQEEMRGAKSGIEQAVRLGFWQAAKEIDSGVVSLGDSPQKALWCQYSLTDGPVRLASDIYVWSHANTFFKLRCTCRAEDVDSNQAALDPLLTAFGSPMVSQNE